MAKSGTLTVKVLGDTGDFDKKMGALGGVAGKAFAAVGLAAAAGAVKSVLAFSEFEGQMNEVFTLLPGISQDAMDDMAGQVKGFAKEFGVLPDKVVPALYQALSAGVPRDNVFEFLETAQKAAKGGVTDLTTAVDGISSVVNAYGDKISGAAEASDLMFTAVRLGKTNFEELSTSLSNVTPIAAGLGVKFDDVAAGMATLTAKGTPTAQATTQLRSLFVELSKAGGKTANTFEKMAGKSFQEFIAEGGNTAEALDIMKRAADESDVQLQDLFGSVEAGAAALSLASGSSFTDNIDEMGASAGATEQAFDRMMKGLGPIFDKIKANIAVFLIDVGQRLAPIVQAALSMAVDAFGRLRDAITPVAQEWLPRIRKAFQAMADVVRQRVMPVVSAIVDWARNSQPVLIGLTTAVGVGLVAAFGALAVAAGAAALSMVAAAAPFIAIGAAIAAVTAGLIWAYQNVDIFRTAVDAVASFLTGTAWPAIQNFADLIVAKFGELVGWAQQHWAAIQEAISHVVNVVSGIIRTFVDVISALWRAWGDDLLRMAETIWDFIRETIENAINLVRSVLETVLALINGDWGQAWEGIKGIAAAVWDQIHNVISTAINLVKSTIGGVLSTIGEVWAGAWEYIRDFMGGIWDQIKDAVSTALGAVIGFFRDLPGNIVDAIGDLGSLLLDKGKELVQGFIDGVKSMAGAAASAVASSIPGAGVVGNVLGAIPGLHAGGQFRAARPGGEGLALLRDGERVTTPTEPGRWAMGNNPEDFGRRAARAYADEMRRLSRAG